jgi:hypothetical protein
MYITPLRTVLYVRRPKSKRNYVTKVKRKRAKSKVRTPKSDQNMCYHLVRKEKYAGVMPKFLVT